MSRQFAQTSDQAQNTHFDLAAPIGDETRYLDSFRITEWGKGCGL